MITGSKELIRDINITLVLETIISSRYISRAAIAKKLGLTKATITNIVQELIQKKLILENGCDDTLLGRKPILLSLNKDAGYVVSIDIGIETISAIMTDLIGEEKSLRQIKTPTKKEAIIPVLIQLIEDMEPDMNTLPFGLIGITLGIHGVVHNNIIQFSPYYDLENIDLASAIEEHFQTPVYLVNVANLSVLGEKAFLYNYANMSSIMIYSGIGMGVIIDQNLYTGSLGYAGEIGHTIVEVDGKECPCGNHGCLEQYLSERALLSEFAKEKNMEQVSFEQFLSLYNSGDKATINTMDTFAKYMAVCVTNIINAFNSDIIIVNSSFTTYIPQLINEIKGKLNEKIKSKINLVPSTLGISAILLGGMCFAIKNFLNINYIDYTNYDYYIIPQKYPSK
jgi:predicted NBD/HSP70 family sugar kinase